MRPTITILLLLLVTQVTFAIKSINKITSDNFNGTHGQVILNGKLFFVDDDDYIWISGGNSENTKPLLYNNQKVKSFKQKSLLKYKDSIIYINLTDGLSLWKTDGVDFEKISDLSFNHFSGIYIVGDSVVGMTDVDTNIFIYDGQNIFNADISGLTEPRGNTVCSLNNGDFTILARDSDLNYTKLYNYSNGMISRIAHGIINDINVVGLPTFALKHGNACYYQYNEILEGNNFRSKFIQISQGSNVAVVESSEGINTWSEIFIFNEDLYFVRNEAIINEDTHEFDGKIIYQLNDNSSAPINFEGIDVPGPISNIKTSKNYLYFNIGYHYPPGSPIPSPPPPPLLQVLDRSFNQVVSEFGAFYNARSTVSPRSNGDVLLTNRINYTIDFIEQNTIIKGLYLATASIYDVFSDDLMTYAIGKDRTNNEESAIYRISDQALISDRLTGLWVSSEWKSQGLSLHTGKRPDGSVYIFASLYIYRNGQPLWLAGSSDFTLGDSEITLELFEFKGSSYLPNDNDTPFETISFGQITLSPLSCDSLDILIKINNSENVSLSLNRIVNTNNANECIP
jgi:hypothetical protein